MMSVYKRSNERWQVLVDAERGADGKRRRRALGSFRTRKEAERAEREALAARDRGVDLSPATVTVGELLRRYLADRAAHCGLKTVERYHEIDRLHIAPLHAFPIAKLRPAHVNEWVSTLVREGRARKRGTIRGLSPKTARHAFALLKAALAWAIRMQLLAANPCAATAPPKSARREAVAFNADEIALLLRTAEGGRWGNLIAFAVSTGVRRGEAAALRWEDVDLAARRVTIRRSLSDTRAGVSEKSTKTDRVRALPLSAVAAEALRRQRVTQAQDKLAAGGAFDDRGFVFSGPLGGFLRPYAITEAFRVLAHRAGLMTTSFHALRHTAGTALIASKVDARTAAAILGHSTPATTLNIYAHVVEAAQAAAVDAIDAFLARPTATDA